MKISTRLYLGSTIATALSSFLGAAESLASSCIAGFYHPTHGYTHVHCSSTESFNICRCQDQDITAPKDSEGKDVKSWVLTVTGVFYSETTQAIKCSNKEHPHGFTPPKDTDPDKWQLVSCDVYPPAMNFAEEE